jgi:hypothetical protein
MVWTLPLQKRTALDRKLKWDFHYDTWDIFKNKVEGGYMQQGMSYPFRKDFLANYEELGEQVVLVPEYDHLGLSVPQIKIDWEALYGTLKLTCTGGGLGSLYLVKYESTLDGFRVWHAFIKEYDNQGCTDVADMKWDAIIQTHYSPQYPGGLLGFTQDYENAFAHLDKHRKDPWEDLDKMKKYWLNLMHEDTKDLVPFIWNMPFSEACNHVKTQAHLQVITSVGTAKHKLRGGRSVNSAKADAYDELMEAFALRP